MPYIGNTPAEKYAAFNVQYFTTSATTSYTLDRAVANELDIRLVINNVVQEPGAGKAYTASGTTLTLSGATAGGDTMYAVYIGKAVQTVNPGAGSVGTTALADNAVTNAKLADATQGDVIYYGAAGAPAQLSAGTSGHFLKTQGAGANPTWAAVAAGVSLTGSTNNTVATVTGANALAGEANLTFDGTNLDLPDNKKIRLGTGNDFEIYHDGSNSIINDGGTGDLLIRAEDDLRLQDTSGYDYIHCNTDGSVELYHNKVNMVETYSSGVWMKDNKTLKFGDGADGSIVSDGTNFKYQVANGAIAIFMANRYAFSDYSNAVLKLDIGTNGSISAGDVFDSYYRIQARFSGNAGAGIVLDNSDTNTNTTTYLNFKQGNSSIGSVQRNGTNNAVVYNTTSDYRLKDNVSYDFDATTKLKELKPAKFSWKSDPSNQIVDGFIAHEVSSVIPEAITGIKDDVEKWKQGEELPEGKSVGDNKLDENGNTIPLHQQIDQSKLVPLLTKALQEAITKIEQLEAKVTALENA